MSKKLTFQDHARALAANEPGALDALRAEVGASRITRVEITHYNVGPSTVRAHVNVLGVEMVVPTLFAYDREALHFTPEELVGLTPQDARTLRAMRDMAYLLEPPTT